MARGARAGGAGSVSEKRLSGRWPVGSGQWAVASGQWPVARVGGRLALPDNENHECEIRTCNDGG